MKTAARLLKYVQSIKFVGGPHPAPKPHAAGPHPLAPEGLVPSGLNSTKSSTYHNSNPVEPQNGEFFARSELSARFRYRTIKAEEIEQVESGGAEFVF
ncbi:hypothetical protein MG5_04170 [Candida albicans P57072]|uniref:Mitochondrial 37S ribosomal protein YMR31 n=3 Tax=Candida albicans TaxID=5476 RepID=A0A1D8PND4_CANAL|nr:mitochondrial 37S ribosomal protein YMR31 [Candida albicans SC5314]KAF6060510.1 hypothetical protein FOB64_006708 [Candida albicans]KGQ85179.1 hypothetical protein MEO_04106 [Candida albicans P94015]KGQ87264.1 hypothetical protein MEU_04169 [Candida albicans P37005]KGQ91542.1 hypothetical protein MG1_04168 [Candida albicans GC75]KGR06368.1 hypothetical protein MG5_04170 [Candida albicans P57072]KGR08628.1 hypothetical protein MG3_04187 [Candida albicans P78048]KGR11923.1 hypothetical prot|eukprot:XP_019330962.1 mitochondrial 37S ribosomal protein YMR31 [Candida albicans SC5314]